ncbi:AMP-binding protein [Streptomyces sp. SP18CS02]|uniref:AMP-binding protein n=1 Tax=Streptomyces sp. SP18CS02 TaxID=3002531 RepID=UPI002E761432|nr:AMP-binding protein [Streptomyces sp. SP18CS02]MEE1752882.1 AMP-binding protein [Streptomyces sp. SP18CS02]
MTEQTDGPRQGPWAPGDNVIDTIARTTCHDTRHHIHYRADGGIRSLSLAELDAGARRVAARLHALGVRARDRVGVMAPNRIEWVLLDLATLKLGAVTTGIEPGRYRPADLVAEYALRLLFADAEDLTGPPAGGVHDIGEVRGWALDPGAPDDDAPALPPHPGYGPADICAIKQTSGSTGPPKGVEVTTASVDRSIAAVQAMFDHRDGDNLMVFLPIRFLQQRYWIYSALAYGHDVTLVDRFTAVETARVVSPTVVMGVPGFYEQLKARLVADGVPAAPAGRGAAIQEALGGRIRYLWTGSAPAGRQVLRFFNDAGVPLYEGYGLTETCIVSKNHPGAFRIGSVGQVLPHKRVRFDEDGVLIVGSSHPVNTRYAWSPPGATEKVFLPTGEVRTYDVGHVDADGFLYIDGRVDDIVTLSGALNILVPLVEERVRELPGVHDCAVFGDGRPYLTAVVSPATPDLDGKELARDLAELNEDLRYEQRVYAAVIADRPFGIENGLLNAQYKLMRADIGARYAGDLERVYGQHHVYNDGTVGDAPVLVTPAAVPSRDGHGEGDPQ